ncbi:prolyl oligopeptidase family serine peptidase [Microlunatus speluncae]|uniref:prolyl oligopeptidase family serine peptidase n=1 Tax=Microlunatus speluncae TaxID=2594267 RepID=UPI001C2CDC6A|nr:prolyl oligopeptidase family serine peptidase [Microlunatus speluncae]
MMNFSDREQRVGIAAGVPYLILPPASGRTDAPLVVGWHLFDPPRTESAFAAAMPLDGLDAWRIYFGLPLCGARKPAGGDEEVMRLGFEDAVRNLYEPVQDQVVAEFEPALAAVREQFRLTSDRIGLLGGSAGAGAALGVLAETRLPIVAAVVVSPLTQLRPIVTANGRLFGIDYGWDAGSDAIADKIDFVRRADELARAGAPLRLVVGALDDVDAIRVPAAAVRDALANRGREADLKIVPEMAHLLAEPPGDEPAPQKPEAAACDRLAVEWFAARL